MPRTKQTARKSTSAASIKKTREQLIEDCARTVAEEMFENAGSDIKTNDIARKAIEDFVAFCDKSQREQINRFGNVINAAALSAAKEAFVDHYEEKIARKAFVEEHVEFFSNNIPDHVFIHDGMTVLSIMVKMQIMEHDQHDFFRFLGRLTHSPPEFDPEEETYFGCWEMFRYVDAEDTRALWYCNTDINGRVVRLAIGSYIFDNDDDFTYEDIAPYDVPKSIVHLGKLYELKLYKARSIPVYALPENLRLLTLHQCSLDQCSIMLDNLTVTELNNLEELNNLTCLTLYACTNAAFSSPFFAWMAEYLPNLNSLNLYGISYNNNPCVLNLLDAFEWRCSGKLETLSINNSCLDDESLKILLLETIPQKFPNLQSLDVHGNSIQSFQTILDDETAAARVSETSKLRRLEIDGNPIWENLKCEDWNLENTTTLHFLDAFKTIFCLGYMDPKYPPKIEYALLANHAGRHLLEGQQDDDDNDGANSIPLSLCPLVLERAYKNSNAIGMTSQEWKNATGIYYLLQNNLLNGHDFGTSISNNNNNNNNGEGLEELI